MNIFEAVQFLSDEAKKSTTAFDIVAGHSKSEGVSVFQGKVQNTEIFESVGVGIRAFCGAKPGYAYTERLTESALMQTLKDALQHTKLTKDLPISLPHPENHAFRREHYNPHLKDVSLSQMTDLALDIEKRCYALSADVKNVPYLGCQKSESQMIFANSNGVYFESVGNGIGAGAGLVAERNGSRKMGSFDQDKERIEDISAEKIAQKSVERALELLEPQKIVSGKMPVVISERVAGQLLGMYASSFIAEQVQKGQSRLQGKLGQKIAGANLTLLSDPTREDLPGVKTYDAEGTYADTVTVVRDGVLSEFLYNLETAAVEGKKSNGCAARSYGGKVGTAFSNLVVLPGEKTTAELLRLFPCCLLVVKLEGNSGCSAISGDMSIGVQGLYAENGEVLHPVEGATLSANFIDLLETLVAIGSEYPDAFSGLQVPALAFPEISVSN